MFDGPDACAHARHAAEYQRYKDEHPQMATRRQTIACQQLEHQQNEMQRQ